MFRQEPVLQFGERNIWLFSYARSKGLIKRRELGSRTAAGYAGRHFARGATATKGLVYIGDAAAKQRSRNLSAKSTTGGRRVGRAAPMTPSTSIRYAKG